jgi:hypothetical protein
VFIWELSLVLPTPKKKKQNSKMVWELGICERTWALEPIWEFGRWQARFGNSGERRHKKAIWEFALAQAHTRTPRQRAADSDTPDPILILRVS